MNEKDLHSQTGYPRAIRELVKTLRRQRKAALRECGHLGLKLHSARMEIAVLHYRIKELEAKLTYVPPEDKWAS